MKHILLTICWLFCILLMSVLTVCSIALPGFLMFL